MPYRANPFLERMSERTTSDQEFVRLFSPKVLERLDAEAFQGSVHIFRSPPGGGKTTLLRAFTPTALRSFWNTRRTQNNESYQRLLAQEILDEEQGPQMLGVFLSCASGYADLPPGAAIEQEGLFRALLDSRIVLRALRSLASFIGSASIESLDNVQLEYEDGFTDLKEIPKTQSAVELLRWAEQRERTVYATLDSLTSAHSQSMPKHVRFEGVLWLRSVRFVSSGQSLAPKRLLMIDDLHKLRKKQRRLLIQELTELRSPMPIWLAERSIALGDELLSQGARQGRDLHEYALDHIWSQPSAQRQFAAFVQNILDRRLETQSDIPHAMFSQYLSAELASDGCKEQITEGVKFYRNQVENLRKKERYQNWLALVEGYLANPDINSIRELYVISILIARDAGNRQMALELKPLSTDELDDRDSSQVRAAADIFMHEYLKMPYYFGMERLCTMATYNVEELLELAASLYEGLLAKDVLRSHELLLSPQEQERLIKTVAGKKRKFIPKNHTEGTRAQRLLDAIGTFCRDRTFLPNAPIAPGVTGVRLSQSELKKIEPSAKPLLDSGLTLRKVIWECVAENLLLARPSAASTGRDGGTIFYLNRTLCAHYGLPLQMGGWQDVSASDLIDWMERGRQPSRNNKLGID